MIGQTEILQRIVSELNAAGVDYMMVGSLAASAHGFVRDSHDLDLVVALTEDSVRLLADKLGDDFYFDADNAREAVSRSDMFNIIHYESSVKVDFWVLKRDEFSRTQFSRRHRDTVWDIPAYVESAEDTMLSKLLWNKITPSERQLNDVRGILIIKKGKLDLDYVRHWADRLGVADSLAQLTTEN